MRAVSDAGPLIHLCWNDRLDVLEGLFEAVLVPPAVQQEVLLAGLQIMGVAALRAAFVDGLLKCGPLGIPDQR